MRENSYFYISVLYFYTTITTTIIIVKTMPNYLPRLVLYSDEQCELKCSTVMNMSLHSSRGHLNLGGLLSLDTFPFLLQVGATRVLRELPWTPFQCRLSPCLKEKVLEH